MKINKIDLVYLWVDGNDKKWQKKKNDALRAANRPLTRFATGANRWRDNDELKYSMRSVEKFAPWINHIYIIADGQRPKWLGNNPKVTVVDHSEIIPKTYLPLFNSNAIEFFIWKIPGLSEHFLYANDDMFFGAPTNPQFFFDDNGNPIVIIKERNQSQAFHRDFAPKPVQHGIFVKKIRTSVNLVYKNFDKKYNITMKHAIEPMRKSYMRDNFEKFEKLFMETTVTRFREYQNIQRIVFPALDNARGRNTLVLNWHIGAHRIKYQPNDCFLSRLWHSVSWLFATVFGYIKYDCYDKQNGLIKMLRRYNPGLFCINDFGGKDQAFLDAEKLMKEKFPKKSEFEK